jgi:hypothetical protein
MEVRRRGKQFPGTNWIGGWLELRAGLDVMEKKKHYLCWETYLDRPARNLSLGRAIAQAVSRWLPTAAARVQTQV